MARFFMYIVLCLPIDFILIAVFPLGITSAALATGISQSIGGFFQSFTS
jgi:Na+-driven multidrug efflux pump